jgi:metal-responsive CopG/Arc/MetJ family transcriptional regulator
LGSGTISFKAKRVDDKIVLEINMKKVVSFKVDEETEKILNIAWRDHGYSSRSDFLRSIIKDIINNGHNLELQPSQQYYITNKKPITFKLEKSLLDKLDEIIEKKGYYNRSDFLRDVLKQMLLK